MKKLIFPAAALGTWAFLVSPSLRSHRRCEEILCDYAHRGLYNNDKNIPENSMLAFKRAVEKGYGIEFDLHLTKDGKIVVFHDDTTGRMCKTDLKISKTDYEKLSELKLLETDERIPLFTELLELVDGKVPLLIELKGENMDATLCDKVIDALKDYKGCFCIESFNPFLLNKIKKSAPDIIRGQLVTPLTRNKDRKKTKALDFCLEHMLTNFMSRPDFISYDKQMDQYPTVKFCRALGALPFVWTVKTEEERYRLSSEGKYSIFEQE